MDDNITIFEKMGIKVIRNPNSFPEVISEILNCPKCNSYPHVLILNNIEKGGTCYNINHCNLSVNDNLYLNVCDKWNNLVKGEKMDIYTKAWAALLIKLEAKTSWGRNELKQLMLECLVEAGTKNEKD